MSSDDTKHVQTELSGDEYERFREFARERGLSLKEAGHEALVEWVERQQRVDPNDRAFTVLYELETDALPASAETNARDEAHFSGEWHGDNESFTLADDPSAQY